MAKETFDCYQCEHTGCSTFTEQLSSCSNATYCWTSTLRQLDGSERNARGCVLNEDLVELMCSSSTQMSDSWTRFECCTGDLCNSGTFPALRSPQNHGDVSIAEALTLFALVLLATLGLILVMAFYHHYRYLRKSLDKYEEFQSERQQVTKIEIPPMESNNNDVSTTNSGTVLQPSPEHKITSDCIFKEYLDAKNLSGISTSGMPLMVPRTLSKQIKLVEKLNEDNFSDDCPELWRGIWLGVKNVTIKIYPSRLESTWMHETEIHAKKQRHDNLLEFVGSDVTSLQASYTRMWLVTAYYPNGSLKSYLEDTMLDQAKMLKACLGLASGLMYLHSEIKCDGEKTKVSIAHRNLSSQNVFVDGNGNCVIGGLEIAVTKLGIENDDFFEVASKRYMSPELLKATRLNNNWSLNNFRQADVYSLSLIIWEICRRCVINNDDVAPDYAPAFAEFLIDAKREPSVEEMRKLIVDHERRPAIPDDWYLDPIMNQMATVIKESWDTKAEARLNALSIKKIFSKLANN